MAPYLGLRGESLAFVRIVMIVVPSFLLFGYNQSSLGGVLAFKSFTDHFPKIDTTTTKGTIKSHNSTIQGGHGVGCQNGDRVLRSFHKTDLLMQERLWLSTH